MTSTVGVRAAYRRFEDWTNSTWLGLVVGAVLAALGGFLGGTLAGSDTSWSFALGAGLGVLGFGTIRRLRGAQPTDERSRARA